MDIFDPILNFIQNTNPFILILGGLALLAVLIFLFRFGIGLVMRILTLGCAVILVAAIVWFIIQYVF